MPTYRYRCGTCGEEHEVWQSFTDTPLTTHEGCGGTLAKVFSPAGIVLKGSGFYKTDSRSNGGRRSTGSDGGGSDKKEKESTSSGSDSKSDSSKSGSTSDSSKSDSSKSGSTSDSSKSSSSSSSSST